MKLYETVIIFKPTVDLQVKRKEYEQVFRDTTDHIYLKDIGVKNLAYKANGFAQGHYVLFCYNSNLHWVNTILDLKLRQDNDVLKFLSTNLDENSETLSEYTRISLSEQDNKRIDALDVLLGLKSYYEKEVM